MSFGFSVGDVLVCSKLAFNAYNALKDAPKEFEGLRLEVLSLNSTLRALAEEADSPNSIILLASPQRQESLRILLENCSKGLQQLQVLTKRFPSLGSNEKTKFLEHVKFTLQNKNGPRDKLAIHTASINIFLTSLTHSSLGRLEGLIKNALRGSFQKQQASQSQFSTAGYTPLRDFKALSTKNFATTSPIHDTPSEPSIWDIITEDLEWERIRPEDVRPFRNEIVAYIRHLHKGGEPFWRRGASKADHEVLGEGQTHQSEGYRRKFSDSTGETGRHDYPTQSPSPAHGHTQGLPPYSQQAPPSQPAAYRRSSDDGRKASQVERTSKGPYVIPTQIGPPRSYSLSAASAGAPQHPRPGALQSQEDTNSSDDNPLSHGKTYDRPTSDSNTPTMQVGDDSDNTVTKTKQSKRLTALAAESPRFDEVHRLERLNIGNEGLERIEEGVDDEKMEDIQAEAINRRTDQFRMREQRSKKKEDDPLRSDHGQGTDAAASSSSTQGVQSPSGNEPSAGLFGAPSPSTQASSSPFGAPGPNTQAVPSSFGAPSSNTQAGSSPFGAFTGNSSGSMFGKVSDSTPANTGFSFGNTSGMGSTSNPFYRQTQAPSSQPPSLFGQIPIDDKEVNEMASLFDHMFDVDDAVPAIAQGAPIESIVEPEPYLTRPIHNEASRLSYPPNDPVFMPSVNTYTRPEHQESPVYDRSNQTWRPSKHAPVPAVETHHSTRPQPEQLFHTQSPTTRQLPSLATAPPVAESEIVYVRTLRSQLESLLSQLSAARRTGDTRLEASLLAPSALHGGESSIQVRVSHLRAAGVVVVNCDLCVTPVEDIHWHCDVCAGGDWDCCMPCEIRGRGCPGAHVMARRSAKAWAGEKYWTNI